MAVLDGLEDGLVADTSELGPRLVDYRKAFRGRAAGLVLPRTTEEVADIVRAARREGVSVVPQGGNTGYCGAATPDGTGRSILMGFDRMTRVREIDTDNRSMIVEAGAVLQTAQEAATAESLMLPLSMGSQGSCRIGGNIGTNAGGLNVLRYGMTRALVLGLEVVLADGSVLDTLSPLRKDNSSLRVEDLFVGTEGTLGIVTAASLALVPQPVRGGTGLLALRDLVALPIVLSRLRAATGDGVSAFEYLSRHSMDLVSRMWERPSHPLTEPFEHGALVEVGTSAPTFDIDAAFEDALADLMEDGLVVDGTIAASKTQATALWAARESIPEAEVHHGGSVKHDLAVRSSRVPRLIASTAEMLARTAPDLQASIYGHVGDGNVHLNLMPTVAGAGALARIERDISPKIYTIAKEMGGSFSAEYGIGQAKRDLDLRYGDPVRRRVAQAVKRSLDPHDLLNPGKGSGAF